MKRIFFRYPLRSIVQLSFLLLFVAVVRAIWGAAGAHNLCPWAVVEVPLLMLRLNINLFYPAAVLVGLLGILATFRYPRPFCGWVCPLGTLFDLLGDIGQKIGFGKKRIPHWLNERMRYFSYGVLGVISIATLWSGTLVCTIGCPAFWICTAGSIAIPVITIVILVAIFVLSLRIKRGFCRYICPYGAMSAVFVPLSRKVIVRNMELCNSCRACADVCPMGIDFMVAFAVKSAHCISCAECIKSCPRRSLQWTRRNGGDNG